MNQINFLGNRVQILSSINEEGITQLREYLHPIDAVLFYNYHPVETDLMQLNTFFKTNKTAYLTGVGKDYLKHLPDLAHVQFSGFTQDMYEELSYLKHVEGVDFKVVNKKIDLSPLALYSESLKSLAFEGDFAKGAADIISQLTYLQKVEFTSSSFPSFEFLQALPLEHFRYYGSRTTNYSHLQSIKSLKHFWLKTNTKWENFDFLSHLENLETVELWYVSGIQRFPVCQHLTNLRRVIAQECNKLSDISELKKLSHSYVRANGNSLPEKNYTYGEENNL